MYAAISTEAGHSLLHALHDRHNMSDSYSASSANPFGSRSPLNASWSSRARPRVECISSRVAMYDGHITPASVLRVAWNAARISVIAPNPSTSRPKTISPAFSRRLRRAGGVMDDLVPADATGRG